MRYSLSVPASSANLGPGYDRLGLALALHFSLQAETASDWQMTNRGEGAAMLPTGKDNLVTATYIDICHHLGRPATPLHIESENQVPVGIGLGSSSTAVVAGVLLAHMVHVPERFSKNDIFQIAANLEGHPDNVGPAIFGGLLDSQQTVDGTWTAEQRTLHPDILTVLAIPDEPASTTVMRGLLPPAYTAEQEAQTEKAVTSLLNGLAKGDRSALEASQWDVKHQPYRFPALPQSARIYELFKSEPAVAGAFLSGAGPTVAGWFFREDRETIERLASRSELPLRILEPDHQGVTWRID
jgi:homoserine kinase